MSNEGFSRYQSFFRRPPQLVIEWHDAETEAVGWLAINSLRNGAAGGGTRMKPGATRDEAIFLAKTMEIKFGVAGPPIGGAKSVIDFDPQDPRKEGVLRRWYRSIGPYLKHCYGTAGDLGVNEIREVIPLTREELGLAHPQEGVLRGHGTAEEMEVVLERFRHIIELDVELPEIPGLRFNVGDLTTGYGVAASLDAYYQRIGEQLRGKRVLVEGFGAVGGSVAYYLQRLGARIVGVITRGQHSRMYRWQLDPAGLDVNDLLARRDGPQLPEGCAEGTWPGEFWQADADVFVPAAISHSLLPERLKQLQTSGVQVIACGANNPFDAKLGSVEIQRQADAAFAVLPDFIANAGIARCFAYLLEKGARVEAQAIFDDIDHTLRAAVERLVQGPADRRGLLNRAFELYVPAP